MPEPEIRSFGFGALELNTLIFTKPKSSEEVKRQEGLTY